MNNKELIELLLESSDVNYITFSKKIANTRIEVMGVKTPVIKDLAKKIIKEEIDISAIEWHKYLEIDLLIGIVNVTKKSDLQTKFAFILEFMKGVDNWAVVDQVACRLKTNDYRTSLKFIKECIKSKYPFVRRFGYVFFLANFTKEESYVKDIFGLIKNDNHYYVEMAEAWLISVIAVHFFELTYDFLLVNRKILSKFIINKSISKTRESYRINDKQKERISALKV